MIRYIKIGVFLVCLGPLAYLLYGFFGLTPRDMTTWGAGLGANPIEKITHTTGDWTLWFLLLTLMVTPVRKLLRMPSLIKFRRMLGLFAFFYGCLHLLTYVWLDKFFDVHEMLADIAKRKFITVGFTGFVLMLPLAITSTTGWIRRLGGKRWQLLHRLIYFSAMAGVIHYIWLVKADTREPGKDGIVLGILLMYRVIVWAIAILKKRSQLAPVPVRTAAD